MGFFSLLFPRPVFIDDAVFGRLRREIFDKATGKAWYVTEALLFAPTDKHIGCYLDTPETGPTPAQQEFYQYIEWHYAKFIDQLIPIIEDEFQNWRPDFRINDFATKFSLTAISIPELDQLIESIAWDWSFDTVHDADHMLTFYMSDGTALPGMQMDG
ncbi:MAG: hypothetical protein M3Y54_18280 [Bacteroidota bacterium]|nr:hypothetical protein [Bacteroidota bacterium]